MGTVAFGGYLGGRVKGAWDTEAGYILAQMRFLMGQAYDPRKMADWSKSIPNFDYRRHALNAVAQNLVDCARM
jgi:hypothetical protein